ncbi:MAG: hypothetical protein IKH11_08495, partial [Bacteroidales bacterium]|nr:hypothetical protein [Bacteroidales bacterium]
MKRFIFLALVAFIVLACSEREPVIVSAGKCIEFTAYQEGAPKSKTIVQPESTKVFWEPGDDIKIFCGNQSARFSSSLESQSQVAVFSGSFSETVSESEGFWAVYPYSDEASFDGESITTVLPSMQVAREESFALGANITVACSNSNHLQFYNVVGGLRFTISEEGVKIITIESLTDERLAGSMKIRFVNDRPFVSEIMDGSSVITLSPPDGSAFKTGVWYYVSIIP